MIEWNKAMDAIVQKPHHGVYTLVGTEFTLMNGFVKALQERMQLQSEQSVEIHRFFYEETGLEGALAQCQTLSLFAAESVVILDNCTALSTQAKGKHDLSPLEEYLSAPADEHVLVITVQAEKLDERKKAAKVLKKFPIINCNTPKEADAQQLLSELAKARALTVHPAAMAEIWRRTQSVTIAERELDKLAAYSDGTVTMSEVEELTPLPVEDNVFRWIEGVIAGKLSRSFQALQEIQQSGYDGFALFSLMARQLRLMWYAKVLGERGVSQQEIAKQAKAHPYAVRMAGQQAKFMSAQRIEQLLCIIADTEFMVKSGRQDVAQALDWIVLSCADTSRNAGHLA